MTFFDYVVDAQKYCPFHAYATVKTAVLFLVFTGYQLNSHCTDVSTSMSLLIEIAIDIPDFIITSFKDQDDKRK